MLPRGLLSDVECPVTSKYVASPASSGSSDFDRRESRATVWKGASASFHSTLAFSIQKPNCPGGAGSCSPLMVVVALGEPGVPVVGFEPRREAQPPSRRQRTSLSGGRALWVSSRVRYCCVSFSRRYRCLSGELMHTAASCIWDLGTMSGLGDRAVSPSQAARGFPLPRRVAPILGRARQHQDAE